jgi:hypothetical protein
MNNNLKVRTEKTETQEDNRMSQADIEYKLKSLEVNNKITKKKEYAQMLHHLMLSLYVLQAPRRNIDYCLMKISSDMTNTNFNYLVLKKTEKKRNSTSIS